MATGAPSEEHPDGYLTPADLSRCLSLREARSRRDNPVYQLDFIHKFFGASNASLMYETVKGDVKSLKTILNEERLPDGFETRYVSIIWFGLLKARVCPNSCSNLFDSLRERFGYTMKEFHMRSIEIFLGKSTPKLPADDIKTGDAVNKAKAIYGA